MPLKKIVSLQIELKWTYSKMKLNSTELEDNFSQSQLLWSQSYIMTKWSAGQSVLV
jgi:hypothetical protein